MQNNVQFSPRWLRQGSAPRMPPLDKNSGRWHQLGQGTERTPGRPGHTCRVRASAPAARRNEVEPRRRQHAMQALTRSFGALHARSDGPEDGPVVVYANSLCACLLNLLGLRMTMASDFAFQPAIERSRIETLATGTWIRNSEVVLMQGPPGVGKSHLLCGLGIRAIQLGFSTQYFRFDELLTALRVDAHLPPARLRSRKYMSSTLLLVDEMGYDPMNREDASLFFRLVSYRYGRGAMIITTNKSIRDWTELLAGDEVLATAILDRLLHHAHVLNIKGRSYRLRDLEDALKS
jgi:hypothetical protein